MQSLAYAARKTPEHPTETGGLCMELDSEEGGGVPGANL